MSAVFWRKRARAGLVAIAALVAPTLPAVEIRLPQETARLVESDLPGYSLATTYCYTCHSVDYVRIQPPGNNRAAWKASVMKMQKTFGAPIPDSAVEPIAEYLVKIYGTERATKTSAAKPGDSKE